MRHELDWELEELEEITDVDEVTEEERLLNEIDYSETVNGLKELYNH